MTGAEHSGEHVVTPGGEGVVTHVGEAPLRALSGRDADELTLEAVRRGEVGLSDLRIHPDTLEHQAAVAERHGNPQLAENLRRAAELTRLTDEEVLGIYEALRPSRTSQADLVLLADSLAERDLPRSAALVREAAAVYGRRGLTG
ncbi:MAG TPA: diol dehydratase small subunit [Acidimicrobiales bacterium]|nr:diol dehydratase small subunit [Acidimicrobiales bacterium]HLN06664.1 diol dehydratase small subunit [Acidimicrobiales bacterium]